MDRGRVVSIVGVLILVAAQAYTEPCFETLFGCCVSDNKTAAQGNDQEGCPPPPPPACVSSQYGCCQDSKIEATGPGENGCSESTITINNTEETETFLNISPTESIEGCAGTEYGCCFDNKTAATGPELQGCPCNTSEFGCCPDGEAAGCGCQHSRFGCCPDNNTVATGPDNKGCGCQYTEHGCCPDRHSEASGPDFEGCMCHTYQLGCCPDGVTIARGPNGQGCYCQQSIYGCCGDEQTHAKGPNKKGCDCATSKYGCCPDGTTEATGSKFEGCTDIPENKQAACGLKFERGRCHNYSVNWFYDTEYGGCSTFWYGGCEGNGNRFASKDDCEDTCVRATPKDACKLPQIKGACLDNIVRWFYDSNSKACTDFIYGGCLGNNNNFKTRELCQAQCEPERALGCPTEPCAETLFGCCKSDNKTAAQGNDQEGCPPPPPPACVSSQYGCWQDNETGATGPGEDERSELTTTNNDIEETETSLNISPTESIEGCAATEYGCCFDNETVATGPELQGCPCNTSEFGCCPDGEAAGCGCQHSRFGCCPDNVTVATGPDNKGCGCRYTEHGCCPDRHSEASGPDFEGCMCHTYQFGCCPDGVTIARGPNGQGCYCQQSIYGCCGDEQTQAKGPNNEGCYCATSKYGCCPDGATEATGSKFEGCTDMPENKQAACSLKFQRGRCRNNSFVWFYDTEYGGCSQFWYGGCEGNENRFASKDDCEDTCVRPPPKDVCKLPQIKGSCLGNIVRWFYDSNRKTCANFIYGGCLGNNNNFETRELCQAQCKPERVLDQCDLVIERGSCAGNYSRWGFNKESRRCEEFIWGGCEGNSNRFSTEAACLLRCNPPKEPQRTETFAELTTTEASASLRTESSAELTTTEASTGLKPCSETLFGCCASDNKTAAQGNDQEGCPPPLHAACASSKYGCCKDNETEAIGPGRDGCSVLTTTVQYTKQTETFANISPTESIEGCAGTEYGCCFDNETFATGPELQGCPCNTSEFGCCPDGVAAAQGPSFEGCVKSCNTSAHGCCPDEKTPAHGPGHEGCCLLYAYGCCPDDYTPAEGPHLEGCSCEHSRFGCCPDNVTVATGPYNTGCSCQYTEHGCCPDRHSEASGPDFEGCMCHSYQFGCCIDGVTIAHGPNGEGCYCQQSINGCCGDEQTHAKGPNKEGCDCATSKYGCCPDGTTEATGSKFEGCTDIPENKQAVCGLKFERGRCRNYSVNWFYDTEYGGCSRFWYSGCEGNGNRFASKDDCEDTCVQPPPKDACKLPQIKGACHGNIVRWFYDSNREACIVFIYGGCLGNNNNFETRELCQAQCEPEKASVQCDLTIERGSCAGNYPRWGFNKESRLCEEFIWGGCEGNSNRFSTEEACLLRCNPPGEPQPECSETQDVGYCTDTEALWSFSQSENRCVPFYYTGCGGNGNKFRTKEECQQACPSAFVPELCTLPASTGDCFDYREKWYFDTKDQRCRQFYYGGCGGNDNKFDTEQQCINRCSSPTVTTPAPTVAIIIQPRPDPDRHEFCFLEIDPGICNEKLEAKWAYDYKRSKCITFQYGGCGGNRNNFPSEKYCTYYCKPVQDICQLPIVEGPCEDSVMSWFYDAGSDSCSQFTYGGCEGNENRFESSKACEDRCKTGPSPSASTAVMTTTTAKIDNRIGEDLAPECIISLTLEACSPETVGEIWYFEPSSGVCTAHENLETGVECRTTGAFFSQEACERSCGVFRNIDVCRYPLDPGPCREVQSKYHYNETSRRCEEFTYRGCLGGPNRFSSEQECQQICIVNVDPCTLPAESGNCLGRVVMWYYDQSRDSCYQFAYSGCGGNDNKFESRELCEGQCRKQEPIKGTMTTPLPVQATIRQPEPTDECRTPLLEPCGTNVTVFYFDERNGRCNVADIGACQYSNSFRTEEECERICGAFRGLDVCHAQLDPGSCRASIPKYYFDAASGSCKLYAYGGCDGGPNRFSTSAECEEICVGAEPDTNESRKCDLYAEECISLEQSCVIGVRRGVAPEGCEQCVCMEIVSCETQLQECDTLRCRYGIERIVGKHGCVECKCFGDPCFRSNCTSSERCVPSAYRDPITHEVSYAARCVPRFDVCNEVSIPAKCVDNPAFANCALIVRSRFCKHKYYSKFCCKSCVEAGQLNPHDVEKQADQPFRKK